MTAENFVRIHIPSIAVRTENGYVVGYDSNTQQIGIRLNLEKNQKSVNWLVNGIRPIEWELFCKKEKEQEQDWVKYWIARGNVNPNKIILTFQGIWDMGNSEIKSNQSLSEYLEQAEVTLKKVAR